MRCMATSTLLATITADVPPAEWCATACRAAWILNTLRAGEPLREALEDFEDAAREVYRADTRCIAPDPASCAIHGQ